MCIRDSHNPEFTMVELYVAYKDYFWMMETTENLLETIANQLNGTSKVTLGNNTIDFKAPYKRISILDSIKEHTGIDVSKFNEKEMYETAIKLGVNVDNTMGIGKLIDEIFGEKCEHHYVQPTFIIDYPKEMSPLTKEHRENPKLTERFELLVNGKELANAYSELNDPIDQLSRFEEQLQLSEKGDDEAMFIDNDFIRALEYGMPPTSGIGIGIDRLVMLFTNNKSIQEVIFFPQMKPEISKPKPKKEDFIKLGIEESWIDCVMEIYLNTENLLSNKATQVHQKLNGFRKKNKLEINALQLEEVEKWFN